MRVLALLTALTLAAAAAVPAQEAVNRNAHRGFWIGFGLGPGSLAADCNSCGDNYTGSVSGYLRMGGSVSQRLLVGGELVGWAHSSSPLEEVMQAASAVALWYPSRTGAFYLKFGLGGMGYYADDGSIELTATAPAATLGLGYEWRVRRNMSIVPSFSVLASAPVTLEINGQQVPTNQDISINLVQFGVGLTWH